MQPTDTEESDPTNGRTPKFERRRNEIIDLSARLFAQHSFAGTGVAEISDEAGLGKGGLYYYIGSKETLLIEIHERVMDPLIEATARIEAIDSSPLIRLRLISEILLQVASDRPDHLWVFMHEYRALHGELLERFRRRRRQYEEVVFKLFEQGAAEGAFQIEDVRITVLGFLGMHNFAYQWLRADGPLTTREISEAFCRIFFEGITDGSGAIGAVADDLDQYRQLAALHWT